MYFCIFEEFVSNMQHEIDKICAFLGVEGTIDMTKVPTKKKNVAKTPRFYRIHLLLNALARGFGASNLGPVIKQECNRKQRWCLPLRVIRKLQTLNLSGRKYPPMNFETRRQREEFYRRENNGLEQIIDINLGQYWPCMRPK